MNRLFCALFASLFLAVSIFAQGGFTTDNLLAVKRVGDPQLSPDGRTVAFTVGVVNKPANRVLTHIYTIRIDGTNQKQITSGNASHTAPRWSPDGRRIAYTTAGDIWTMEPDGDDRKRVTSISTGAGNPVWSPDGRLIAFNSDVYPECTSDDCNKNEDARVDGSAVKAKVTERLLFKHWNEWRDRKRAHVFVVQSSGGVARDLTPGDFDAPPYGALTGLDYAFSPDSREIAFLKNPDKIEAISTNSDVIIASLTDGSQKNISLTNKGYDAAPIYTPDGKYLIYRSQRTATFEADRWRIMRYNRSTGETVELTKGFNLQADDTVVSADGKTIYFAANERGKEPIFTVPVEPNFRQRIATHVRKVVDGVYASGLNLSRDGRNLVFLNSTIASPAEIMRVGTDDSARTSITRINDDLGLTPAENINWRGALNTPNHGFIVKPANFDSSKKYPLIVLIHGGPQSAFNDSWGYRWNPQIFANAGYIVFMPNPRGSTGYGQKFVNDISGDWGGKAFVDIKNGIAKVIRRPYIDRTRIGGAGASYGGYMVDWILGHNDDPRFRFKALVSHAGVYNLESMATATEEIWFVNWEFKGMPWQNPAMYQRWSPHKFANKFNTPTLVTAGELDFRVPVDQSLQLFTTLQLKGVESRLIIFPDEGHWILKPQNSEFWYKNVLDWFGKHLNK